MPSKKVRIDPDTVYRSKTPLQQKKFPSRRRSVRPRANVPPKLRQQSTLTQLPEWSISPGRSSEYEDEEDDLEKARPRRKKRRTAQDGKKQATLTQMVSSSFGQDQYDGVCDNFIEGLHDDDEEEEEEDVVRDSQLSPRVEHEQDKEGGNMQEWHDASEKQRGNKDRGSQDVARGRQSQSLDNDEDPEEETERVDSARGKASRQQRPSPELPLSTTLLRTPTRRFLSEIPSSNTPQSAILSIHTIKSMRSPERSPLKTKSANVWSQQRSPNKSQLSPVLDTPVKPVSPFRLSPLKTRQPVFRVPEKPPSLVHRSTIPDSEDTATQITPFKKASFRSQIPDTQFDTFGEEIAPITDTQFPSYSYTQPGGETYHHDEYPSLDPVCSALDRDAARFMQTQLLQDMRHHEAFHKEFSFSQDKEEEEHPPTAAQQSQELGEEPERPSAHRPEAEVEHEDAPTQSPAPSPKPTQAYPTFDDIEVLDLTEVGPTATGFEVIRIASSPSGKSVSSGKYPSSPPATDMNDPPPEMTTTNNNGDGSRSNSRVPHSSPLLPALELPVNPPRPSQVSTVGGTQLFPFAARQNPTLAAVSSSPPALPPSTSSPPPEAKQQLSKLMGIPDSEDEDEDEDYEPPEDGNEDQDLNFWTTKGHRRQGEAEHSEDEDARNRSRIRDILPDTLLDFSLPPPPPTQSSVRSLVAWR